MPNRSDGQPRRYGPLENQRPTSVQYEACGVHAPGRTDGEPMQHYDGRVPNAHNLGLFCDGKP